jgi:bifunctional non-homologous end joining protein LigD
MTTLRTRRSAPSTREGEVTTAELGGRRVDVSHPGRVLWPETGTTKRELIEYFVEIAPVLLPYLRRRATMLWRFPEGVDGPGWFQAQCRGRPGWVPTFDVVSRRGHTLRYCLIEEPATLGWLANIGTIELHPHAWTVDRPDLATSIVFDLDPGPPADLRETASVALTIAARLRRVGLDPVVKTSGVLGLHVAAALEPRSPFDRVKAFSRTVAEQMAEADPEAVTARSDRSVRAGRVYIDWIENDARRQLVAPYSPRATPRPGVSVPLTWDEIEAAAGGDLRALRPTFRDVLDRVGRLGDRWLGTASDGASLPDVNALD